MYELKLQAFEGPLDLLLHLIERDKLDVYDIPVAQVTQQYLAYLNQMQEFNLEIASEFLVMAATLLQIKSRMLLPKSVSQDDSSEAEEEDPRVLLMERLVTYRRIKLAAAWLAEKTKNGGKSVARPPLAMPCRRIILTQYALSDLLDALAALFASYVSEPPIFVSREEINIQDKMLDILALLRRAGREILFSETVFRSGSRHEQVSAFLGVLELLRLKQISIRQTERFGPIYVALREAGDDPVL